MSQTTKRALAQSLKKLLQTKPLSKITINDIAEDCGVSRMTFYYHFADIYDLVEWTCQEGCERRACRQQDVQHMAARLPEHLPSCLGKQNVRPERLPLYQP